MPWGYAVCLTRPVTLSSHPGHSKYSGNIRVITDATKNQRLINAVLDNYLFPKKTNMILLKLPQNTVKGTEKRNTSFWVRPCFKSHKSTRQKIKRCQVSDWKIKVIRKVLLWKSGIVRQGISLEWWKVLGTAGSTTSAADRRATSKRLFSENALGTGRCSQSRRVLWPQTLAMRGPSTMSRGAGWGMLYSNSPPGQGNRLPFPGENVLDNFRITTSRYNTALEKQCPMLPPITGPY